MTQNTSHAVMQQRHEAHDSLDDFPTPPFATRALIKYVLAERANLSGLIWEPTCNRGYMVRPLREVYRKVLATDIHDYGFDGQDRLCDFLFEPPPEDLEWVVANPPFRLAAQFIAHALKMKPTGGVCMIVRTAFLEGQDRYETLFSKTPPSIIAQFVERVPMVKGRFDPKASTATSYVWLVWLTGEKKTKFVWIPPCRRQLQKASDA